MTDFKIIEKLGGRKVVYPALRQINPNFTTDAAFRMWTSRGMISASGILALMELAQKKRVKFTPEDFRT